MVLMVLQDFVSKFVGWELIKRIVALNILCPLEITHAHTNIYMCVFCVYRCYICLAGCSFLRVPLYASFKI